MWSQHNASFARAGVDAVEAEAIAALLNLTLKLSEKAFKPRFLRLTEWAATPPAGADAAVGRATTLFAAAHALTARLRCCRGCGVWL